jgi:uncharacterized protein YprB with RNaseH-like and TPR domain
MPPKILYFDIETFPLLAHVWSRFVDGPVVAIERDWNIACIAWQWEDGKVQVRSLKGMDPHNDTHLLDMLWSLFNEADVVIGHNGNKFDIKKVQARFLLEGFDPPSPFTSVDTLSIARRHFALTSNKLNDLCQALGMGAKVDTGGWSLWAGCLEGDDKSWTKMEKYNKQDIVLLRNLYLKLRPWATSHPVLHVAGCPVCGSDHVQSRGTRRVQSLTYRQFQCMECKGWFKSAKSTDDDKPVYKSAVRR